MSASGYGPSNGQFLRKAQLVVSQGSNGLDLSQLRFTFRINASDCETPNTAFIRVYNLKEQTRQQIIAEYDSVTLQAGYEYGNYGIVFQGSIKQFRFGKERNVDSYLEIQAADGDQAYNFGIINQSFAPGSTYSDQLSALAKAMNVTVDPNANGYLAFGGIIPQPGGKVMFGMARLYMSTLAKNNNCRWSIQNGVLTLIPLTGYLPGTAVAINSSSGMIGTPEQTDNGIKVRCYLNPLIKIGQAVQINNADINQAVLRSRFGFPKYRSQYYPATVANDGIYRVIVAEYQGDTRGNDWFTELTCLDIDPSSPANTSVLSHG